MLTTCQRSTTQVLDLLYSIQVYSIQFYAIGHDMANCTGPMVGALLYTLTIMPQCQGRGLTTVYLTGFETDGLITAAWPGGETEALVRLERHLERKVQFTALCKHKIKPECCRYIQLL